MKNMPADHSRFLAWLAVTTVAGCAMGILLVLLIDPYGLYGLLNVEGINSVKPGLSRYQYEIKLTHAARLHPDTVIFGNSRAEIGFDPEAAIFTDQHRSAYNLAISATSVGTPLAQLNYLQHIGATPRNIILGVEFIDFLPTLGVEPHKPAAPAPSDEDPVNRFFWRFDSLSSLTSIIDALHTLRIQHDDEAVTMTSRGFNPLKEYHAYARSDGYYAMFRQRALENTKRLLTKSKEALKSRDTHQLRALLDLAAEDKASVKLIIYPYHAQILALFEATGLWPSFEAWKAMLIAEVAAAHQRHPGASIELMDFSGFGGYRCERIPLKGDRRSVTHWYWEAGHFKKELGDIVLSRIFSSDSNTDTLADFGTPLDAATLIANQQRIARERKECVAQYPELFQEVASLVAVTESRHEELRH